MDYKFFLRGIKNIVLNPAKAWETIDSENKSASKTRDNFFFPLAILVSIAAIVGSLIFTNATLSPVYSLFVGIKCFVTLYITVYIGSFIMKEITFPLDLGRDFNSSFKILVYSLTPLLLCLIISYIFESLLFLDIIGLYGLYIFWTGAEKILNPPRYKKIPLLIATSITVAVIYIATNIALTKLIDKIYYLFFA